MKKLILLISAVACSQFCFSQTKDFRFRKAIDKTDSAGWYSIALQPEIFKRINKDFSDLRIYQFNEKDTVESPYVLKIHEQEITEEVFHPQVINQTKKNENQYFTFELPNGARVNFIDLSFNENNFDGYVTIEGGNDQNEWFEIAKRERIISIVNHNIDFSSTKIYFSEQSFKFIRTKIEVDKQLSLKEVSLIRRSVKPAIQTLAELSFAVDLNKKEKQSIIKIELKYDQPVVKLLFEADERRDYYRTFRLEKLSDSSSTPKGWQYFYETIFQGFLTSLDTNQFAFNYSLAKKLRLVIDNGDDSPLSVKSISLFSPKVEVIANMIRPSISFTMEIKIVLPRITI
ncbi:MAG: hypothetical protein QM734_13020 [Cyclobacteriaceae bacterium]